MRNKGVRSPLLLKKKYTKDLTKSKQCLFLRPSRSNNRRFLHNRRRKRTRRLRLSLRFSCAQLLEHLFHLLRRSDDLVVSSTCKVLGGTNIPGPVTNRNFGYCYYKSYCRWFGIRKWCSTNCDGQGSRCCGCCGFWCHVINMSSSI